MNLYETNISINIGKLLERYEKHPFAEMREPVILLSDDGGNIQVQILVTSDESQFIKIEEKEDTK